MKIAAYFPSDYLPDVAERIAVYRKLSSVKSEDEVSAIEQEIRDRFDLGYHTKNVDVIFERVFGEA